MSSGAGSQAPTLFLVVDAIPYDMALDLWRKGAMEGFAEPRPVVSVFPSLTHVAVPALLRGVFDERPPGYEAHYYEPGSGELRGSLGDAEADIAMEPFRVRPRGLLGHVAVYALRRPLAQGQIRWITHRFEREGGSWLGYLSATDGVAHFGGRRELEGAFRDICAALSELRRGHQRREGVVPQVVLCSDHGMAFGHLAHLSAHELTRRLQEAGFRPGERGGDGFVLVPYGDVGAGVVHCAPENAARIARAVACTRGVELAFGRTEEGCVAFASREGGLTRARIGWREGAYCYQAEEGDPLDYGVVWKALVHLGRLTEGWAPDRDLFALSWTHPFPDALARVRCGMEGLVEHAAPVLFSMRDDHSYGPALTHAGARLMGGQIATHGGLGRAQSLGFATLSEQSADPWPGAPALRPEDVFRPWRDMLRAASRQGGVRKRREPRAGR